MLKMLRAPSARPELVLDQRAARLEDPVREQVGFDGPLGRSRVIFTLPLLNGPTQLQAAVVLHDNGVIPAYLGDPQGNLIGFDTSVWVGRMLTATKTWDTRRL